MAQAMILTSASCAIIPKTKLFQILELCMHPDCMLLPSAVCPLKVCWCDRDVPLRREKGILAFEVGAVH